MDMADVSVDGEWWIESRELNDAELKWFIDQVDVGGGEEENVWRMASGFGTLLTNGAVHLENPEIEDSPL